MAPSFKSSLSNVVSRLGTHCVPDLQLDLFSLDVDHSGPELDPDRKIVNRLEPFVGELKEQT